MLLCMEMVAPVSEGCCQDYVGRCVANGQHMPGSVTTKQRVRLSWVQISQLLFTGRISVANSAGPCFSALGL